MNDIIGERMRRIMDARHMSLRQLARLTVIPVSSLSAYFSGDRQWENMTLKNVRRLANAFDMTMDHLFFREDDV